MRIYHSPSVDWRFLRETANFPLGCSELAKIVQLNSGSYSSLHLTAKFLPESD